MASYPQPPWTLQGSAVATLHVVDIDRVRALVPRTLDIIPVFPGKTIGGVYVSRYTTGSVLEYNELIVAVAVSHGVQIGGWVTHIYVDNSDSVAGGREIWKLPKQLATFAWGNNSVTVRQGDVTLCSMNYNSLFSVGWKPRLGAFGFSSDSDLFSFGFDVDAQFGLLNAQLSVPLGSPFANLIASQPWLAVSATQMRLSVKAPEMLTPKR